MTTTMELPEIHPHAARSIARMTVPELQAAIEMSHDALQVADNPEAPAVAAVLAHYEHRLAQLTGIGDTRTDPATTVQDGVGSRSPKAGSAASNQFGTFAVHAASEKQVAFLARLLREKDLTGITVPATLEGINKKAASALIDKLVDRAPKQGAPAANGARPASEKQVAFLQKLAAEKNWAGVIDGVDIDTDRPQEWIPTLSGPQASKVIDALMAAPRRPVEVKTAAAEIKAGAYRLADGRIVRVYYGRQSGQMLASELVDVTATSRDDAWNYLGRADRFVKQDDHRLTTEEAEALNDNDADHGWCCVCGAFLDDPNSVRRGIGPVCRAKQGGVA